MMDRLFETFDPFDLVGGVPRDLLTAEREALPEGAYLRLSDDVLDDDGVVDVLATCGAIGLASWFTLLVMAKRARAFGVVTVHAHRFGQQAGCTADEAMRAFAAMERANLVWSLQHHASPRTFRLRIRNWQRWQSMTDAERSRLHRARKTEPRHGNANGDTGTPSMSQHGDGDEDEQGSSRPTLRAPAPVSASAPAREEVQPPTDFTPLDQPPADEPKWWEQAAAELAFIHQGDPAILADLAQRICDDRFSPRKRHDERWKGDAYIRAAADLQSRFAKGWRPRDGSAASAIAFYFSTIASHRVALPELAPAPTETHTDDRSTTPRPRHAGLAAFD